MYERKLVIIQLDLMDCQTTLTGTDVLYLDDTMLDPYCSFLKYLYDRHSLRVQMNFQPKSNGLT